MNFEELLATESVAYFGDKCKVPKTISNKKIGRVSLYIDTKKHEEFLINSAKPLGALSDISRFGASISFLSGRAVRVLIAKYPNSSAFVVVELSWSLNTILMLIGLLRRLKKKSIKLSGLRNFDNSKWLVLRNMTSQVDNPIYMSLDESVGVQGFIDFLNDNQISYVFPRFFEKFPDLYRPGGGDIDILVHDQQAPLVRDFLKQNSGPIPVDLHTVFGPAPGSGDMPYFVPNLALQMLESHTIGPINSNIPNAKYYFLSFLYHILFHKGFFFWCSIV